MTLIETIESLAKMPSGAIFTDENRYDQLYLISIANKFRAAAIRKDYQINKRINPNKNPIYLKFPRAKIGHKKIKIPNQLH